MKKSALWLGTATLLTIIFATIYTVGQQSERLNANSPQIQIAEDVASQLNSGKQPTDLVSGKVDMQSSLAAFIIIYSKTGQVVAGSGYLNGQIPIVPYGVLTHANPNDNNWVTWQPQSGVRLATVEVAADHYYVLSGRSMREIENIESSLLHDCTLGWLAAMVVLSGMYFVSVKLQKRGQLLRQKK